MPKNYNRVNRRKPQFKLNWKPSPFDSRDFVSDRHLKVAGEPLPSEFVLPIKLNVYDQKNLGSCTANSGCSCYKYEASQLGKQMEPSRLFLYYNTREIEGTVNEDSGAYIRDVFKALNKRGLCEEKYFPYIESTFRNRPSQEAYNNGLKYQTTKYTAVPKSLTTIKQTLYSGAAISFGFLVYSSFFDNWSSTTGDMPIPKKGERVEGGHAVTIYGYSDAKQAFYILNSWGNGWGKNGYFWMPYSFLLSDNASDFWCIDEIKIEDQPTPPSPTPTDSFKTGLRNVLTKPDLIKMTEPLIVKIGKELGLDTSTVYSKPKNIELVWNHLTS